ncbi:MAG: TadE/TadG family type IV pilus assembly protein [Acidimicrobiia bacterium]
MRERGTAAIELALVFMIMLMLAIGTFEWGTGFADRINLSSAVREGARVGAAAGDNVDADCRVIEAAAGALNAVQGNSVKELYIYESDTNGTFDLTNPYQQYRPSQPGDVGLLCTGAWFPLHLGWQPAARQSSGAARDWLGVRVVLDHDWKTGFLWWNGTVTWHEDAVVRLEPKVVN